MYIYIENYFKKLAKYSTITKSKIKSYIFFVYNIAL